MGYSLCPCSLFVGRCLALDKLPVFQRKCLLLFLFLSLES